MELVLDTEGFIVDQFEKTYEVFTDGEARTFTLKYTNLSIAHPFYSDFIRRILTRKRPAKGVAPDLSPIELPNPDSGLTLQELSKALCISNLIVCLIKLPNGSFYFGTDGISTEQHYCITDVHKIKGYAPCKKECKQEGHGEPIAVINMLKGLDLMDDEDYLSILDEEYDSPVISHRKLIRMIKTKGLSGMLSGLSVEIFLQGHSNCCPECAELLYELGVREVNSSRESHQMERDNRASIHNEYFATHEIPYSMYNES